MQRSTVGKAMVAIAPPLVAVIYVCALSAIVFHDKLLSNSVDLAHHLQLVEALKGVPKVCYTDGAKLDRP